MCNSTSKINIETNKQTQNVMAAVTWPGGGKGLAIGGTQELDVRGMKPASLPLLASNLEGTEPVRVNRSAAGSLLNSNSSEVNR